MHIADTLSVQYFHGVHMGTTRQQVSFHHCLPFIHGTEYIRSGPNNSKAQLIEACFSVHDHILKKGNAREIDYITSKRFKCFFFTLALRSNIDPSSLHLKQFLDDELLRQFPDVSGNTTPKPLAQSPESPPAQPDMSMNPVEKKSDTNNGNCLDSSDSGKDPLLPKRAIRPGSNVAALPASLVKCTSLVNSITCNVKGFDAEIQSLRRRKRQVEEVLESKRRKHDEHETQNTQLQEESAQDTNMFSFENEQKALCEKLVRERKNKANELKQARNRIVILEGKIATSRIELSQLEGSMS